MKKLLALVAFSIVLTISATAQNDKTHHTLGSLEKLNKLELSKIYIGQMQRLNSVLPYVPFNQKGETVSLASMGIPSTKDNNEVVKRLDASSSAHNEAMQASLFNVLPYADKGSIIKSILFLQNVLERIETGIE